MTASASRTASYQENRFYSIVDALPGRNYFFGNGSEVSAVARGANAYAQLGPIVGVEGPEWFDVGFVYDPGVAGGALTPYAIDIAGSSQFDGNNTVNGDIRAGGLIINGSNVRFNSASVTGNIVFETAGSLYINGASQGGSTVTGNVNFGRHDGGLTLAHQTAIRGSVTGTGTDNASLTFEGSGIVEQGVGPIRSLDVLGNASLVQLNTVSGNTNVASLNVSADLAVVEVRGLLTGNVNMGGHFSKLELLDRSGTAAGGANGMKGVLDFGMYKSSLGLATPDVAGKGTLEIGNDVNVTFSNDPSMGIMLTNAGNATLLFAGNSVVTGDVGSAQSNL